MKEKMDDQSLNGEELRKMYPNSDFLLEEYDPVIVGVNEETNVENKTTLDFLIDKTDVEMREFIKTLNSDDLSKTISEINRHISDHQCLIDYLINIRRIANETVKFKLNPVPDPEEVFEKIEKLKKELLSNPDWEIYYDEGVYFVKNMYGEPFPIDVELREMFPDSYFHSPECDQEINGYNSKTGSIIYDLWRVGKMEMRVSEGIESDFHDTGYGIGRLLSWLEDTGYGEKIPPTHILPPNFIDHHSKLQGSMYHWGYDVSLVNDIGRKEHLRLDLENQIESNKKSLEEYGNKWTEEVKNSHQKRLENLMKELNDLSN
jgi:hypothetical protein